MRIYIVRHAAAEERDDLNYPDDALRPLTAAGRKQFKRLIKQLSDEEFCPEALATSPLLRCRQTAEVIAEVVPGCPAAEEVPELAPGCELAALIAWTERRKASHIAWVGHAPDVEDLTATLIGGRQAAIHFSKGTIAAIDFEDDQPLAAGAGELRWLVTTKLFES